MLGNWIQTTSTTGGAGTLTLSAVTGSPGWSDIFGAVTRWVNYDIVEYADSTGATVSKAESGIGSLDGSTLILTRTKVLATWTGGVYANIAPAAISFGTTAANVRVRCGPTAAHDPLNMPWVLQSIGDGIGIPSWHTPVATAAAQISANQQVYSPFLWPVSAEVNLASIDVTTRVNGGAGLKASLYELASTGLPGTRVMDLTASAVFDNSATGIKSLSQSFWLPRGWYYQGVIVGSATPVYRGAQTVRCAPIGSSTGTQLTSLVNASGNFTTGMPSTGPASASLAANTSLSTVICVYLRARL